MIYNHLIKHSVYALVFTVFLLNIYSCAGLPEKEKTAKELFEQGIKYFDAQKYKMAIDSFNNLKDWYPFSVYAIDAELKTADAHFNIGEYIEAIFSYQDFERLHPSNEKIPYVIYQLGMCYMRQLNSIDRDQMPSYKAIEHFQRLIREYSKTRYAHDAINHINICYKKLVYHEYYIGNYYFRTKKYKAALTRFQRIVSDFPDVGIHKKAIDYMSKCHLQLIMNDKKMNIDDSKIIY